MLRYGIAVLAVATAVTSAGSASAASPFDGRWSVLIQTRSGACDSYRYRLAIVNGNVTYAGEGGFQVRGHVAPSGAVHVRVSSGSSYADGHGRLTRSSGSGTWRGIGSGVCAGVWTADRRG